MSAAFMLLIAGLYICAAGFFVAEGKLAWALVALCWGTGNFVLGVISQ